MINQESYNLIGSEKSFNFKKSLVKYTKKTKSFSFVTLANTFFFVHNYSYSDIVDIRAEKNSLRIVTVEKDIMINSDKVTKTYFLKTLNDLNLSTFLSLGARTLLPSKHTTLFRRLYNVHNVKTTSYGCQNNVVCVLGETSFKTSKLSFEALKRSWSFIALRDIPTHSSPQLTNPN